MNFRKSIRWRVQSWHGLLLLAVIAGFGFTCYRLQVSNAWRYADGELEVRLGALTGELGRGGQGAGGPRGAPPPRAGGSASGSAWNEQAEGAPGDAMATGAADERGPGGAEGPPEDDYGPPEGRRPPPPRDGRGPEGRRGPEGAQGPRGPGGRPGAPNFSALEAAGLFDPKAESPYYFYVWSRNGPLMVKSEGAPAGVPTPDAPAGTQMAKTARTRGGFREVFTFTPPGECLLVGRSTEPVEREVRAFTWKLGGVSMAVVACGLVVGWYLSGKALRPIGEISAAAARIAEGNLAERIRPSETQSELGQLAAVLDDTFQRLDQAFEEQARFTSDAAHELRTPVSVILGQTQLALGRERSAEEHRGTIEVCQRAAKRMHGLIESLLDLATLDQGREKLKPAPCDLAEICREHVTMLQPLAGERGITLELSLEVAPCQADAGRIGQVADNLLGNALKFTPPGEGRRVRVSTRTDAGGAAVLEVSDEGPGIPRVDLPHLFERFYRADASRNRSTGGAGLGLAICKSIVDAHGGNIEVESIVGKGSVFRVALGKRSTT